jgi:PKD repeat protein
MKEKIKKIIILIEIIILVLFLSNVAFIIAGTLKNKPPIALASSDLTFGKAPLEVNFTGFGSDSDGIISSYYWDFGENIMSNEQNPTHIFHNKGKYIVQLIVTDDDGDIGNDNITVYVIENIPPTAQASASPTKGKEPLAVAFFGKGTDNDGRIVSYHWDFADGQSSNEQNPIHTYRSSGNYHVKLTVTDDNDATDIDEIDIDVDEPSQDWFYWYYWYCWRYHDPNSPYYPYPPYWNPNWPMLSSRPIAGRIMSLFKK